MWTDSPLPLHEALSGIFGSVSLASWIFLLVPQLLENYREGSAEGISLAFLVVWFIGDLANFFGAVWAGLVPTVIALAVYFCFADAILITQCLYYNFVNEQKAARQAKLIGDGSGSNDPEQPLLRHNSDNIGLPGSRRRSSVSTKRRDSSLRSPLPSIPEVETSTRNWLKNFICIILVCLAGCLGWVVAWKLGAWKPTSAEDNANPHPAVGAEILGYLSAVAYLGARIPQIVKNHRERSCEGLSLLFFMLSLLGNATYGAGILFHSIDSRYVLTNLPWLIGSLGTMFEDTLIFIQFHMYAKKEEEDSSAIE
ncbi:hypothetical protein MMC32_003205 [Xylographa parallela]|nr:hypothetical protein [Xylographa parallela]